MYVHYAESRRWKVETAEVEEIGIGGMKSVTFMVSTAFFVFFISLYDRRQAALFFHKRAETLLIVRHGRLAERIHDLFVFSE